MIYFTPKQFPSSESSHYPILIKLVQMTEGPILELGTGFFSTPLLHWLCAAKKRKLISYESDARFIEIAKNFISDFHQVCMVDNWDKIDIESQHWSIALIDHSPGPRRKEEFRRLANNTDYVVVHDSEHKSDFYYHLSDYKPLYKYHFDYTKIYPNTSVFSNFKDLSNFSI